MKEIERAQLLINFIEVAARGLVKPYDLTAVFKKLNDIDVNSSIYNCCPQQTEVRDTNNVRPYIMGACDELTKILKFEKQNFEGYGRRDTY